MILIFILIPFNFQYANVFKNTKLLWSYSLAKEPTNEATTFMSDILLNENKILEAYTLSKPNADDTEELRLIHLHLRSIMLMPNWTLEKKSNELEKIQVELSTKSLFPALLYLNENNPALFEKHLLAASKTSNFYQYWMLKKDLAIGIGENLCHQIKSPSISTCQLYIKESKKSHLQFNTKVYPKILEQLQKMDTIDKLNFLIQL